MVLLKRFYLVAAGSRCTSADICVGLSHCIGGFCQCEDGRIEQRGECATILKGSYDFLDTFSHYVTSTVAIRNRTSIIPLHNENISFLLRRLLNKNRRQGRNRNAGIEFWIFFSRAFASQLS